MRTTFIETLTERAADDERIWLLTGDLGFSVLEPFASRFPDRFINTGVAEQNMTGVAAGLALSGNIVFTYSIANFPTLRCLEQIRNDVCYHNADVKIVAVGAGVAYGTHGYTHHGVEDLAILRTLPNLSIVAPADPVETRLATRALIDTPGPGYLRLEKAGEPVVHQTAPADFCIGKGIVVRDGSDVTLVSIGGLLKTVVEAAAELAEGNVQARVISLHTLKPLDAALLLRSARETGAIVCVEEHRAPAPLYEAVCALVVGQNVRAQVADCNLGEAVAKTALSQTAYRQRAGLTAAGVAQKARQLVERKKHGAWSQA